MGRSVRCLCKQWRMFLLQASFLLRVSIGNSDGNKLHLTFDVSSSFLIIHLLGKVWYRLVRDLPAIVVDVLRQSWHAEPQAFERVVGARRQNKRRRGHFNLKLAGSKNPSLSSTRYSRFHIRKQIKRRRQKQ